MGASDRPSFSMKNKELDCPQKPEHLSRPVAQARFINAMSIFASSASQAPASCFQNLASGGLRRLGRFIMYPAARNLFPYQVNCFEAVGFLKHSSKIFAATLQKFSQNSASETPRPTALQDQAVIESGLHA
jgi:hypothetical protein